MKLSEAEVKLAVSEYLEYQMNQGKLWYARLNAGDFIEVRGSTRRRIKGAPKGTADFIVIQSASNLISRALQVKLHMQIPSEPWNTITLATPLAIVTFVECKSSTGKLTLEQEEFAEKVKALNCRYIVVRSVDEVMEEVG